MKPWILSLFIAIPVVAGVFWILASVLHIYPDPIEVTSDSTSWFKERPLPRGSSGECLALRSETKSILEEGGICQSDEECTFIDHQHCPFGCITSVNKENFIKVHAALDKFQEEVSFTCGSSCVYGCMRGTFIASCVNNKCQTDRDPEVDLVNPGYPPVPKYPFDEEPNKSLNTDTGDAGAG